MAKETKQTEMTQVELDDFRRASEYYIRKESSNIKQLHYEKNAEALIVEFSSGSIYRYTNVSAEKFAEMKKADSVTKYLREAVFNDPNCPTEAIRGVVDGVGY